MDFAHALTQHLVDSASFVLNTNLFLGRKTKLPVKGSAALQAGYIVVVETGGPDSLRAQRSGILRPTVQLASVAETAPVARALMATAYEALGGVNGLTNVYLSTLFCQRVVPRGSINDMSVDVINDVMFTLNVDAMVQATSSVPPSGSWVQEGWL